MSEARKKRACSERRRERSRTAARSRRGLESQVLGELARQLPLGPGSAAQLDKASVMRLALSYLRLRRLLASPERDGCGMTERLSGTSREETVLCAGLEGFLLLVLSPSGQVVYASEGVSRHTGITQLELMGQSVFEFVHPCDQEEMRDILHCRPEPDAVGRQVCDVFVRMKCTPTSQPRAISLKSASWKVLHCTGVLMAAQRVPGPAPGCLALLCRSVPVPSGGAAPLSRSAFLSRHSPDMRFTYCQPRVVELTGYEESELLGRSVYQYYHALDSRHILKTHHNLFSKGQSSTGQYRLLVKRGGYVWVETDATVVYNSRSGQPQSVICVNYILSEPLESEVIFSLEQTEDLSPCPIAGEPLPLCAPLSGGWGQLARAPAETTTALYSERGQPGQCGRRPVWPERPPVFTAGNSSGPEVFLHPDSVEGGVDEGTGPLMERLLEWSFDRQVQHHQQDFTEADLDTLAPYIPMDGEDFQLAPIVEEGARGPLGAGSFSGPLLSLGTPDRQGCGRPAPSVLGPQSSPSLPRPPALSGPPQRGALWPPRLPVRGPSCPRGPPQPPRAAGTRPRREGEWGRRVAEVTGGAWSMLKRRRGEGQPTALTGEHTQCGCHQAWERDHAAPLWKRTKLPLELRPGTQATGDPSWWSSALSPTLPGTVCGCSRAPQGSVPWAPAYTGALGTPPGYTGATGTPPGYTGALGTPPGYTGTPGMPSRHPFSSSAPPRSGGVTGVSRVLPVLSPWECEVNAPLGPASSLLDGAEILSALDQAATRLEELGTL
ncbi:hypoxia-inducible factor 3-alpha-like isoform X2 [Lepisosteus oculatus]|uniref:hypoxia-inducible factor 3-alpha-like isoform X2 n=1 Tax=Lepisosteus oculatus TaxID=7918 RepID=UPI0035F518E8